MLFLLRKDILPNSSSWVAEILCLALCEVHLGWRFGNVGQLPTSFFTLFCRNFVAWCGQYIYVIALFQLSLWIDLYRLSFCPLILSHFGEYMRSSIINTSLRIFYLEMHSMFWPCSLQKDLPCHASIIGIRRHISWSSWTFFVTGSLMCVNVVIAVC